MTLLLNHIKGEELLYKPIKNIGDHWSMVSVDGSHHIPVASGTPYEQYPNLSDQYQSTRGQMPIARECLNSLMNNGGILTHKTQGQSVLTSYVAPAHPYITVFLGYEENFNNSQNLIRSHYQKVGALPILNQLRNNGINFLDLEKSKQDQIIDRILQAVEFFHTEQTYLDESGNPYLICPAMVHRDIKPGNLLLEEDLVTPFLHDHEYAVPIDSVVVEEYVPGTRGFIPPEGYLTGFTNHPTRDIFSLGVTLAHLMLGNNSYRQVITAIEQAMDRDEFTELMDRLARRQKEEPLLKHSNLLEEAASDLRSKIPEPILNVILKASDDLPEHRYQTAAEMRIALKEAYSQS